MSHKLLNELHTLRNEIVHKRISQKELTEKLELLGLFTPENGFPNAHENLPYIFDPRRGLFFTPEILRTLFSQIVEGKSASVIFDPWAGFGDLISIIQDTVHPKKTLAFTRNLNEGRIGKILVNDAEWQVGDPTELIKKIQPDIDIVTSVLPFTHRPDELTITAKNGKNITLKDNFENLLLVAASLKLKRDGIGIFVVLGSFFWSPRSVIHHFEKLGLGVEAALFLPPGTYSPYSHISSYLIIVRRSSLSKMFVAQISDESSINDKIIFNLKNVLCRNVLNDREESGH